MGLLLANLDCEIHWARQHTPGPHKPLPPKVRASLALASRVLVVFTGSEDELWTLDSPPPDFSRHDRCLAWGQVQGASPGAQSSATRDQLISWQEALWSLRASPQSAALCNDRRFTSTIPMDPKWTLPEISTLDSMEALDHYLQTSALGPRDAWVAKAPFSAAGRERIRRHGRNLGGEERVFMERLMARYGQLVLEPWMPRVADYGCAGLVYNALDELLIFAPHELQSDETGVFRGVRIADADCRKSLGDDFADAIDTTARSVGKALHAAGYRGPFGIDAFSYQDRAGQLRLQTLSEINARLCFGLVARALAEKLKQSEYLFRL